MCVSKSLFPNMFLHQKSTTEKLFLKAMMMMKRVNSVSCISSRLLHLVQTLFNFGLFFFSLYTSCYFFQLANRSATHFSQALNHKPIYRLWLANFESPLFWCKMHDTVNYSICVQYFKLSWHTMMWCC